MSGKPLVVSNRRKTKEYDRDLTLPFYLVICLWKFVSRFNATYSTQKILMFFVSMGPMETLFPNTKSQYS